MRRGLEGRSLLRARKRSSERMAMALSMSTRAGDAAVSWGMERGRKEAWLTVDEVAEAEEKHVG